MVDYILHNKEWIFSGIGVTVIVTLFLFIRYLLKNKRPMPIQGIEGVTSDTTTLETADMVKDSYLSEEDIYIIMKELDEMPPLHLDDVTKNYIGLNVDWLTEYWSASKKDDDLIRVSLYLENKSGRSIGVYCNVKLSDYKQFSILKRKAKIRVTGKIAEFEPYSINLSNVLLFFQK